jgi:hypothetical protein
MLKMFSNSYNMFTRHRRFFLSGPAALFIFLLSITVSHAQRTSETNSGMIGNDQIQGKVFYSLGNRSSARPVIKLQSLSSPEITGVTDQDGNFRFTHLRPDLYTVIVEAGDEYEKAKETVAVGFSGPVPAQGVRASMLFLSFTRYRFTLEPTEHAFMSNAVTLSSPLTQMTLCRRGNRKECLSTTIGFRRRAICPI